MRVCQLKEGNPMMKRLLSLLVATLLALCAVPSIAEDEPIVFDAAAYISSMSGLDLRPYGGKVIVLHFFTASGEECRAQLPALRLIYDDFDKEGVEIVLVHAWDGEGQPESDEARESFDLEGMRIYEDEGCALSRQLGITQYPNTLFLGGDGNPVSGYGGRLTYETLAYVLSGMGVTQLQNSYLPKE